MRCSIPNKKDLLQRLVKPKMFSKFDMKIKILANQNYSKGLL